VKKRVLVVDVGGSHVKVMSSGSVEVRRFDSGPDLGPAEMVDRVLDTTEDWSYDVVSVGFPGAVHENRPQREPHNLGTGWVDFDYRGAFGRPIRMLNDAALQALGSYHGGRMLFLGLGTGLGSALISQDAIVPLELAHLPWKDGRTYEQWVGEDALERDGVRAWRTNVLRMLDAFRAAFPVDYTVVGGGNVRLVPVLPEHVERGANDNAFRGGFLLWERDADYRDQPD
jgi:polyphosphate glucokinase